MARLLPPLPPLPPLCSVPGDTGLGQKDVGQQLGRGKAGRGGGLGSLPGLQMGACSTVVVDVRTERSRSRSLSRSRSRSEEAVDGLVR